ncbi:hypothetical protein COOONC_22401 [Cooperia oncophora]
MTLQSNPGGDISVGNHSKDDASFLSRSESDFSYGEEVLPSSARKNLPQRDAKIGANGINLLQQKKANGLTLKAGNGNSFNKGCIGELEDYDAISSSPDGDVPSSSVITPEKKNLRQRPSKEPILTENSAENDSNRKRWRFARSQFHNDSSFVVSDSNVSSATNSDGGSSDESWTASDDDQGRIRSKQRLLNSIKDSFNSPSVLSKSKKELDPDEHFLVSLAADYPGKRHPDAEVYVKKGIKNENIRMELTTRLFNIFRRQCFKDELPEFLPVRWNNRLCKTAGMCRNMSDRTSCVELSPKVCSTPDRVRDTLIHELCHAAVWVVDGRRKEGHGPLWKKMGCSMHATIPSLPVIERCHAYEIDAKYIYECGGCGQKVKRHSKSLNIDRMICGICKSRFTLQARTRTKKGMAAGDSSELNPFAKFVKENYGKHKGPGVKHGEVMRILAQLYKERTSLTDSVKEADSQEPLDMSVTECPEPPLDMSVLSIHD